MKFILKSESFENHGIIPVKYTCDGEGISPPLEWENFPAATKSFVLIVDDYDAPMKPLNLWLVYNIPVEVNKLEAGVKSKALPKPARMGQNGWKAKNYSAPCPASVEHHYYFTLYALNKMLEPIHRLPSKLYIEESMRHHILDQAVLIGKYKRIKTSYTMQDKHENIEDAINIMHKKKLDQNIKERASKEIEEDVLGHQPKGSLKL